MKYARLERERRFLLAADPPASEETRTVEDRYLVGTSLRLRRVTGKETIRKLGKQEDLEPGVKRVTTIYLSEAEYALLVALPANAVTKRRSVVCVDGIAWAVDTYPDGTRTAETEDEIVALPDWIGREITGEPEWSGAVLAERAGRVSASGATGAGH